MSDRTPPFDQGGDLPAGVQRATTPFPEPVLTWLQCQDIARSAVKNAMASLGIRPALAAGQELTSGDVEPPVGTVVVTDGWGVWSHFDDRRHGWQRLGDADATQSWAVVVATYGPVRVLTLTTPKEFS